MSDPFIGQIVMFGGNFAPSGWAECDGQLLAIAQNSALFSILGTTYGGDGRTTFGLPDMRGRVSIHPGSGPGLSSYSLGQKGGAENVVLTVAQLPSHEHTLRGSDQGGDQASPSGAANAVGEDANRNGLNLYANSAPNVDMRAGAITPTGSGSAHPNIQPFVCVNYIMALTGIYPSRS